MRLKCKRTAVFLVVQLFIFWRAFAASPVEIPATPGNPVVDLAGIIDAEVETQMNQFLRELEQKTSAQMAVLTIASLEGQSIEDFSLAVAHDQWKLGQKGKDNGVLLVVAPNDRKYRIEVGYGLEGVLPDSLVGGIGRQFLVPYFRRGEYSAGIYAATLAIANTIAKDAGVKISGMPVAPKKEKSSGNFGQIIFALVFLVVLIGLIKNPRFFLTYLLISSMGGRRGHWGGGSNSGFGGGGFGSFGGGGGGFGGGGASGSW